MTSAKERYAWMDAAACRTYPDWDEDPSWWVKLKVCEGCPVRPPCLADALERSIGGVRGGTMPDQRGVNRLGRSNTEPYVTMVDGRPDRTLFDGQYAWWLEHGSNEHLPSIGPRAT